MLVCDGLVANAHSAHPVQDDIAVFLRRPGKPIVPNSVAKGAVGGSSAAA
jgi:hypothetical protein